MKKKFKLRKQLMQVLDKSGISDKPMLDTVKDKTTGAERFELINPQRRVVKAILQMSEKEQISVLENLKQDQVLTAAKREEDNKLLENS
jgi:hypothetical protein